MEHKKRASDNMSDEESAFARYATVVLETSDIDPGVRDFAVQQVFSSAENVGPSSALPRRFNRDVDETHDSDINLAPGHRARMTDGSIAQWLHETALRLYPDSSCAAGARRAA